MDPTEWGKYAWPFLHTFAANTDLPLTRAVKYNYIQQMGHRYLPCAACRNHFASHWPLIVERWPIEGDGIDPDDIDLTLMMIDLHNEVNISRGVPTMDPVDFKSKSRYSLLDRQCLVQVMALWFVRMYVVTENNRLVFVGRMADMTNGTLKPTSELNEDSCYDVRHQSAFGSSEEVCTFIDSIACIKTTRVKDDDNPCSRKHRFYIDPNQVVLRLDNGTTIDVMKTGMHRPPKFSDTDEELKAYYMIKTIPDIPMKTN